LPKPTSVRPPLARPARPVHELTHAPSTAKAIGQLWRDETPEVRRFWELEAQRAKARHRELYPGPFPLARPPLQTRRADEPSPDRLRLPTRPTSRQEAVAAGPASLADISPTSSSPLSYRASLRPTARTGASIAAESRRAATRIDSEPRIAPPSPSSRRHPAPSLDRPPDARLAALRPRYNLDLLLPALDRRPRSSAAGASRRARLVPLVRRGRRRPRSRRRSSRCRRWVQMGDNGRLARLAADTVGVRGGVLPFPAAVDDLGRVRGRVAPVGVCAAGGHRATLSILAHPPLLSPTPAVEPLRFLIAHSAAEPEPALEAQLVPLCAALVASPCIAARRTTISAAAERFSSADC